jgi:peptidoglycan/xylan/chitin deacetylase (PgdA/CDA1 family)
LLLTVAMVLVVGAEAPAGAVPVPPSPASSPPNDYMPDPPARRNDRTVALTFDDGPSPYTPAILAVLRRHGVPATFCMLGDQAQRYPAMARQVAVEGHQLCNHSRDHRDMARLSAKQARREVMAAERQIRDAAGVAPTIFRFPYGSSDPLARQVVHGYGMRALSWTVDPQDWTRPAASTITRRIVRHVRPGSIVLMHDGGGDRSHTVASLAATIRQLERHGYRFVLAQPSGASPGSGGGDAYRRSSLPCGPIASACSSSSQTPSLAR